MGHTVTICPDGTTAAAALERNTYDCILVDLDMPGMNGIDVIARAKELSPAHGSGCADRQYDLRHGIGGATPRRV